MRPFGILHRVKDRLYASLEYARQVELDGVKVLLDPTLIPRPVSKAVARGDYELPERRAVKAMVRPGDQIVEMGGGIGVVSVTAAQIAGPHRVTVFEPQAHACALIRQNATLNGVEITCHNSAVGTVGGTRSFFQSANIISSSFVDRGSAAKHRTDTVAVEVIALRDIVADLKPNVLISDIEGAEIEVLSKFDFTGIDVVIIEMHPHITGIESAANLASAIERHGLHDVVELREANTYVFARDRTPKLASSAA